MLSRGSRSQAGTLGPLFSYLLVDGRGWRVVSDGVVRLKCAGWVSQDEEFEGRLADADLDGARCGRNGLMVPRHQVDRFALP
ncbi:hypothetical protein GCM10009670_23230 [Citricoccus alkalitolerans]